MSTGRLALVLTCLGREAVPALADVDAQPEFTALPLTADEFDAV